MQRYFLIIFSISLACFLVQCKSKSNKSKIVNDSRTAQLEDNQDPENVIIDIEYKNLSNPYKIREYSIEDDILTLMVSYKNACKDDDFNLYSSGMFLKSLPPQANVFLELVRGSESCAEKQEKELQFNISALKYQGQKKVVININTHENKVDYVY